MKYIFNIFDEYLICYHLNNFFIIHYPFKSLILFFINIDSEHFYYKLIICILKIYVKHIFLILVYLEISRFSYLLFIL